MVTHGDRQRDFLEMLGEKSCCVNGHEHMKGHASSNVTFTDLPFTNNHELI